MLRNRKSTPLVRGPLAPHRAHDSSPSRVPGWRRRRLGSAWRPGSAATPWVAQGWSRRLKGAQPLPPSGQHGCHSRDRHAEVLHLMSSPASSCARAYRLPGPRFRGDLPSSWEYVYISWPSLPADKAKMLVLFSSSLCDWAVLISGPWRHPLPAFSCPSFAL